MSHTHTHGWYWLDDSAWIPYDKKLIDGFEKSYHSPHFLPGHKKIAVDAQRYIEIMPLKDVLTNFVNVASDPDIIGMQRRYDDPMKRRVVKRSSLQTITFFDNHEFCFYSTTSQKSKTQEIKDVVKMCGGKFVDDFTKKTDYLIFKPNDLKDDITTFNAIVKKAEGFQVDCVESTWIDSCVKAKKKVDHTQYIVKQKPVPVAVPSTATKAASNANTASVSTSNGKSTKSSSSSAASNSNTLKPYAENLIKGSQWTGVCSSSDDHFPFILTVDNVDSSNDEVSGTITWINLGAAQTKYKGKLNKITCEFNFEEYEIITGEDEIEVPNTYTSIVYGDEIIGKVTDSTFKLKLTKSPPVTHMQPDSKWNGTSRQPESFKLEITKRDNENIMGKITWVNYDAFGTFKGIVTSTHIDVIEYKETSKNSGPEELSHPFKLIPIITQNQTSSNGTTVTTTKTSFKIQK